MDRKGRPKAVAYWVMAAWTGSFAPNEEVDELRWLDLDEAARTSSPTPVIGSWWPSLMAADQVEPLI